MYSAAVWPPCARSLRISARTIPFRLLRRMGRSARLGHRDRSRDLPPLQGSRTLVPMRIAPFLIAAALLAACGSEPNAPSRGSPRRSPLRR